LKVMILWAPADTMGFEGDDSMGPSGHDGI